MGARFWFYLGAVIVIAGLATWQVSNARRLEKELNRITNAALSDSQESLGLYLGRQNDSRKLVSLATTYAKTQPDLVKPVVLRAFELNPDSRDIALMAAPYSSAAKERVKFLDPLYVPGQPTDQSGQ